MDVLIIGANIDGVLGVLAGESQIELSGTFSQDVFGGNVFGCLPLWGGNSLIGGSSVFELFVLAVETFELFGFVDVEFLIELFRVDF